MNAADLIELSNVEGFLNAALVQSSQIGVDILEFRTIDESWCSAVLFSCKKNVCVEKYVSFLALLNHELHFYQEWNISETSPSDLELIAKNWLMPEINNAVDIPASEAASQIGGITSSIRQCIEEVPNSVTLDHPDRWGVFLNGSRLLESHKVWLPSSNCNVIALSNEWNGMEFLYETPASFILFSWGTGA